MRGHQLDQAMNPELNEDHLVQPLRQPQQFARVWLTALDNQHRDLFAMFITDRKCRGVSGARKEYIERVGSQTAEVVMGRFASQGRRERVEAVRVAS